MAHYCGRPLLLPGLHAEKTAGFAAQNPPSPSYSAFQTGVTDFSPAGAPARHVPAPQAGIATGGFGSNI